MADEKEDQEKIERVAAALEARLRANPIQQPNARLSGWKAAGVVAAVLTAIATPVLTITWFMSNKMQSLDSACEEIKDINSSMGRVRQDVQRLREAFIAHTQQMLPYLALEPAAPPHSPSSPPQDPPASSGWVPSSLPQGLRLDPFAPAMTENLSLRPGRP